MSRKVLLARASALAMLVAAGAADAETFTFTTPGFFVFTVPVTGEYLIGISGASGGSNVAANLPGGLGASIHWGGGSRTLDLGDDACRLCRPRLARSHAQAQDGPS
jgi:hypothetical protein